MTKKKHVAAGAVDSSDLLGVGTLHEPKSMFLRTRIGEAACGKLKYEMSTLMNGAPIVHSRQTGKWFLLSWQDILTLAKKAGIDTPNSDSQA